MVMFVVVCYVIYIVFCYFKKKFIGVISGDGKFYGDMERYCLLYVKLVEFFCIVDDIFLMYVLVIILIIILFIIFMLYFVFFEIVDMFLYVVIWWFVGLSVI